MNPKGWEKRVLHDEENRIHLERLEADLSQKYFFIVKENFILAGILLGANPNTNISSCLRKNFVGLAWSESLQT